MKDRSAFFCLLILSLAAPPCAGASLIDPILLTRGFQSLAASKPTIPDDSPRFRTDGWFAADKADHFFTSAMLSCSAYLALRATHNDEPTALVSSLLGTLTVGIGKEVWDVFHPGTPSWKDLTADLLGTLLGIASAFAMTNE